MAFTDLTDEAFEAIKTFFAANWSDTGIRWPNERFDNPSAAPFVIVEIHGALYAQMSIGAEQQEDNRWDEEGTAWFHVMVTRGDGASNARGAAKAIARLFRGTTLLNGRMEFLDAVIGAGDANDEDGNWFRMSVSIDWRLMEA